jgi:platelet-activating factor acetylhydrolase
MLTLKQRPRWTIKRLLFAAIAFYVVVCYLFDMPLLSSKLPAYAGPYEVGVVDIEAPVEKRNIGDAVFKGTNTPAFALETVLFSVYYPAVKEFRSSKPHHPWVGNIPQQAEGYARFAGVSNSLVSNVFSWALWTLIGSTTVPANVDIPIHGMANRYQDYEYETPIDNEGLPQFPVIVFSHGMASSRTSYTQWCGELASLGFVVAAIEHRDGSGPGTAVMLKNGSPREVFLISESMLDPQPETSDFKAMQVAMRLAEIEETVKVLRQINDGFGQKVYITNSREEGEDLAGWKGRLNMGRVVIGGHSYGATTALQALKDAPCEARPFVGGIVLDPGKHSGHLNDDIDVPIMVVHSQSWSARHSIFEGRPHFTVVKDLVNKIMRKEEGRKPQFAWFLTAKGTSHPSVTDAPLIEPFLLSWTTGSTIDVREGVMQYVKVSQEFMRYLEDGHRTGVLAEDITHPNYDEDVTDSKRKRKMSKCIAKYWQIHVAPSTSCPFPGLCGVEREERG